MSARRPTDPDPDGHPRGRHHVTTGDVTASTVIVGDDNAVTVHESHAPVDVAALVRFAAAVSQALPALALTAAQHQRAQNLTIQIIRNAEEPEPDHPRLRSLGRSLRTIMEGATAGALGTALLGVWPGA